LFPQGPVSGRTKTEPAVKARDTGPRLRISLLERVARATRVRILLQALRLSLLEGAEESPLPLLPAERVAAHQVYPAREDTAVAGV